MPGGGWDEADDEPALRSAAPQLPITSGAQSDTPSQNSSKSNKSAEESDQSLR